MERRDNYSHHKYHEYRFNTHKLNLIIRYSGLSTIRPAGQQFICSSCLHFIYKIPTTITHIIEIIDTFGVRVRQTALSLYYVAWYIRQHHADTSRGGESAKLSWKGYCFQAGSRTQCAIITAVPDLV